MKSFADRDVEVIGVSGDSVKTQEAFKKHEKLTFALLADEKGDVAKAFGVPAGKGGTVKKKIDDKEEEFTRGCSIQRWTFVIDKAGRIRRHYNLPLTPEQVERDLLPLLRELSRS